MRLMSARWTKEEIARYKCLDCKINVIESGDWYLCQPDIWEKELGLSWEDNLCVACLETRLGRKLRKGWLDIYPASTQSPVAINEALVERWGFKRKAKRRARKNQ